MASLFRVNSEEEGVFQIQTNDDGNEVCSVVFDNDMDGALSYRAQRTLMLKLAELMQKVCHESWRRQE